MKRLLNCIHDSAALLWSGRAADFFIFLIFSCNSIQEVLLHPFFAYRKKVDCHIILTHSENPHIQMRDEWQGFGKILRITKVILKSQKNSLNSSGEILKEITVFSEMVT